MNQTQPIGPSGFTLGGDSVTITYNLAPNPYAVLHVGSALTLHATPGVTDPATLLELAARAAEAAGWLQYQAEKAQAGELNAA